MRVVLVPGLGLGHLAFGPSNAPTPAYMAFPKEHWSRIASTNPLERRNGEIKRRSDNLEPKRGSVFLHHAPGYDRARRSAMLCSVAPIYRGWHVFQGGTAMRWICAGTFLALQTETPRTDPARTGVCGTGALGYATSQEEASMLAAAALLNIRVKIMRRGRASPGYRDPSFSPFDERTLHAFEQRIANTIAVGASFV